MIPKTSLASFQWLFAGIQLLEMEHFISKNLHQMSLETKTSKSKEIITNHVGFSLGAALLPFPGADLLAVSGVQLNMLRQLAKLYNVGFLDSLGKNIISALVGGSAARLGASLVKAIPGVGTVIGELSMPVLAGASTYALGKVITNHFEAGGTLENFDPTSAKKQYKQEMEEGRNVATQLQHTPAATPSDEAMEKLKKLAEMREAGIISDEEFARVKARLLEQL